MPTEDPHAERRRPTRYVDVHLTPEVWADDRVRAQLLVPLFPQVERVVVLEQDAETVQVRVFGR